MTSPWELEQEDDRPQLDYQVKSHLVLEDSDKETWGLVRFIGNSVFFEPGQGEVVGTWSRPPIDDHYHVFLETPITALVDKATQLHVELVKKRREGLARPTPVAVKTPTPDASVFTGLRKGLKGGL